MPTTKIWTLHLVVIPRAIRREPELQPRQMIQTIADDDRIEMVRIRSLNGVRGFLAGIVTTVEREFDHE